MERCDNCRRMKHEHTKKINEIYKLVRDTQELREKESREAREMIDRLQDDKIIYSMVYLTIIIIIIIYFNL